jgi:hypothetical protein
MKLCTEEVEQLSSGECMRGRINVDAVETEEMEDLDGC